MLGGLDKHWSIACDWNQKGVTVVDCIEHVNYCRTLLMMKCNCLDVPVRTVPASHRSV